MLSPLSPSRITYTSSHLQLLLSLFQPHSSIYSSPHLNHPSISSTPSSQLYPTLHITNPASKSPSPTSPIPPPSHIPAFPNSPACKYINPIHITHTYTHTHKHYKAHYPLPITHHPYLPSPTSQYIPPIPKRLTYTYTYLLPLPDPVHYLSHHSHFPQFPLPSHLSQFSLPIPNPQSSILNLQSPISFPHQPPNPVSPSVHKSTPLLHSTPLHSTPALKNPPF